MSAEWTGSKRRWAAAAGGAFVVLAVLLVLARIPHVPEPRPSIPAPSPEAVKAAIEVAPIGGADRTLREATEMHDQTPLFLPTERNVSLRPPPPHEAGSLLLNRDQEKLAFTGSDITLQIPPPVAVPEKPAEAVLGGIAPAPLHGLAQVDAPLPPLQGRGGIVEVFSARTNRRQLVEALPISARPATEKTWRPIEFAAAVDPAGLVGSLVVTERSDAEEVERYFRNYLAQTFRVGERLPPGFYRIVVGP